MLDLDFTRFYAYEEMRLWLENMSELHPDKMKLETLTETHEGRKVFLVTLADFTLGDEAEKRSAYFVKAGVHAQETAGTTAALAVIERILNNSASILKDIVFYIVPRVNPDGTEFAISNCFRSIRSKIKLIPGLPNALVPCDINGDGMILQMRRKNPAGDMKELDECPGVMAPREPGDTDGDYYDVWCEGVIENYNGGEPVLGFKQIDFNRILPANWHSVPGGEYPVRQPEVKAVTEFEVNHPNIFAAVDIHCGSNAILRPVDKPDSEVNPEDLKLIIEIGKVAEEITGYPLMSSYSQYITAGAKVGHASNGTSNSWNHSLGRSHYVIELGNGYNSLGYESKKILREFEKTGNEWLVEIVKLHKKHGNDIVVPWVEYKHPQLGDVEIGGLKGGNSYFMLGSDMLDRIPRVADFVLRHAAMRPQLKIENIDVKNLTGGFYRIRCDVINVGDVGTKIMQDVEDVGGCGRVKTYLETDKDIEILSRPVIYEHEQLKPVQRISMEWFVRMGAETPVRIIAENPRSKPAIAEVAFLNCSAGTKIRAEQFTLRQI